MNHLGYSLTSTEAPLILVVDDDDELRHYMKRVLVSNNYIAIGASNGFEALPLLKQQTPDLIILDLLMPYMDGLALCSEIRRTSQCPIMILSALHDEPRKVAALEEGADDYLTKPFGAAELLARVNALLRRANQKPRELLPRVINLQEIKIDLDGNMVMRHGVPLRLTRTELKLLKELARRSGKIVTHQALLKSVWGPEYSKETQYLHVYIGRLRRKLEQEPSNPRYILTEPGIGYRLVAHEQLRPLAA